MDLSKTSTKQWKVLFTLLAMPSVSEIMINGPDNIFMTKNGKRVPVNPIEVNGTKQYVRWEDNDDFMRGTEDLESNMVHYGNKIRESFCLFEGSIRLMVDGKEVRARTHIVLPPVAVEGFPQVTMVKNDLGQTMQSLTAMGTMNSDMRKLIQLFVEKKKTVVVSGGSGAGKTTLLSAMVKYFKEDERVIVCEDAPELRLDIQDVSYLASYPDAPGRDAKDQASLAWVVAQVNRMRPARVIIGETRGPEFADFLTAANSGYEGSLTTIHADDPNRALGKMARFVKKSPGAASMPMSAINKDIAESIDYIVQIAKIKKTGEHKVTEITEVSNIIKNDETAAIRTNKIWEYKDGMFSRAGYPEDPDIRGAIAELARFDD